MVLMAEIPTLGNAAGSPQKSWMKCLGRAKSGLACSGSCHRNPTLDKRRKMGGWMDGWVDANLPLGLESRNYG